MIKQFFIPPLIIITSLLFLNACSATKENNFNYFNKKADFNIAQISLNKIVIIGLIDDTKSLSAQQKQQATAIIFDAFADQVESDSLIDTETLALKIGINKYKKIKQAAKNEDINKLVNLAQTYKTGQYLLIARLTQNTDHNAKQSLQSLNSYFDDCRYYGRSISLKMAIIDINKGREIWGGQLNKSNKENHCYNDDNLHTNQQHNDKEALAWLMTFLVISAISDNNDEFTSNDFKGVFRKAVNEFAQKLPSFYH